MGETLLINVMPGEIRAAALDGDRVVELFVERRGRASLLGNVYLGRVERILNGMDAAFVDIGIGRAGFIGLDGAGLRRAEAASAAQAGGSRDGERIADHLTEGQAVRVQVVKDAAGRKGVQLTRRVTLPGRYVVYAPLQSRIAVSRQIEDEDERARLTALIEAVAAPGEGFIVRTAAVGAEAEDLAGDAAYLRRLWSEIEARQARASAPALLHEDLEPLPRLFRDRVNERMGLIRIDSPGGFATARDFCARFMPRLEDRLELYSETRPLFEEAGVEAEIERALRPRIELPSGGEIVIEGTEALTAVDVNSGRYTGTSRLEDTAFATNLEAAAELPRQLRLRNIGGLVIVDFIHMAEEAHWEAVIEALDRGLAQDRTNVRLIGRTAAGVVEITRRRRRESLAQAMTEACPACGGLGRIGAAETVAHEIMRALRREARAARPGRLTVMASGDVVDVLEGAAAGPLAELAAILGRRIVLARGAGYGRETFDIVAETESGADSGAEA